MDSFLSPFGLDAFWDIMLHTPAAVPSRGDVCEPK